MRACEENEHLAVSKDVGVKLKCSEVGGAVTASLGMVGCVAIRHFLFQPQGVVWSAGSQLGFR